MKFSEELENTLTTAFLAIKLLMRVKAYYLFTLQIIENINIFIPLPKDIRRSKIKIN